MNKVFVFTAFLSAALLSQGVFADDATVSLKKKCVRDYPLVEGETDQALLGIYAKVCDARDNHEQETLLVQAAQRYQQLGKSLKALQLASGLQARNVQSTTLTDVQFMAGAQIANDAITKMRNQELRYLSTDVTYPSAKTLVESINTAKPATVMTESEKPSKTYRAKPKRSAVKAKTKTSVQKPVNKPAAPVANTSAGSGKDPFSLVK